MTQRTLSFFKVDTQHDLNVPGREEMVNDLVDQGHFEAADLAYWGDDYIAQTHESLCNKVLEETA
jgi:hypothetical protein